MIEMLMDVKNHFGKTLIIVTHANSIASLVDRSIRIADGKMVEES